MENRDVYLFPLLLSWPSFYCHRACLATRRIIMSMN